MSARFGSGSIACDSLQLSKADQMLREVYRFYDKNSDGTVTFNEIFDNVEVRACVCVSANVCVCGALLAHCVCAGRARARFHHPSHGERVLTLGAIPRRGKNQRSCKLPKTLTRMGYGNPERIQWTCAPNTNTTPRCCAGQRN